jgi:hypothetical protein
LGFYYGEKIIWSVAGAIMLGLIAAIFLDDFWEKLLTLWRWLWW